MSTAGFNDFDGFSDRRTGRDHIIDDHDVTFNRGSDGISAFAVILDFLTVISKGRSYPSSAILMATARQGNAFICRSEDHVALDTPFFHGLDQSAGVKVRKF